MNLRVSVIATSILMLLWASTAQAQSRVRATISDELPHVEASIGMTGMAGGPASDSEQQMRAQQLGDRSSKFPRKQLPWTQQGTPGLFAQVHVAVAQHATIGYLVSLVQEDTHGARTAVDPATTVIDSAYIDAHQSVKTRAVIVSYRPNAWLRIGAGPAIHERTFELRTLQQPLVTVGPHRGALGWVAGGELKFARTPATYDHPPIFGQLIGQYRAMGSLTSDATVVSLGKTYRGVDFGNVTWPSTSLRYSHWMVAVGVGMEF